jgi:four helix bundle protein
MNKLSTFENLTAWQAARSLTKEIYRFAQRPPMNRDFGFADQARRAAVSVMNNLAEGWESLHRAEKAQFYNIARRSCGEVRSMSYVMLDIGYVSAPEQVALQQQCTRTGQLVSGLLRSTRSSSQTSNQ